MAESVVCIARSFSQPSPTSDEKEGKHLHGALTTSISFGRFMSESLDWEKWSSFTQNRYMEEVEKYSKPGSVAEKKAYFEAHFKRRKAAASLEQQNAAASINSTSSECLKANAENLVESGASSDLNFKVEEYCVVTENTNCVEISNERTTFADGQNVSIIAQNERTIEASQHGQVEKLNGPNAVEPPNQQGQVEKLNGQNAVEPPNQPENDVLINDSVSKAEDRASNKVICTMRNSSLRENKSGGPLDVISSSKSVPSPPCSPYFNPIVSVQLKNSEKTPNSKDHVRGSGNKRRSYTQSLHMSINLACLREPQKATSPTQLKVDNTKLSRAPTKKFKNSMQSQTSTTASVNGIFKHHVGTTFQANRKITTNADCNSQSRTLEVQSLSKSCSKFPKAVGSNVRPPTVVSPFTFRSEERAAKRKEFYQKLEQQLKSMEMEKQKTHTKPQVKRRDNFKDLLASTAIRATKDAEPSPTTDFSNNLTKKVSTVKPYLPKVEEKSFLKDNNSRPRCRISTRKEGLNDATAKNKCLPVYNSTRCSKIKMNENSSPNLQL